MTKRRSGIPSDVELLQRVKAHDDVAWTELVRLYGPLVDWWLSRAGLGRDDRDDAFQDVFTTVARQIREFRCNRPGDTFRGWLRVITRSRLVDHLRRTERQISAEGGDQAQQQLLAIPDLSGDRRFDPEDGQEISLVVQQALDRVRAKVQSSSWDAFWRVVVQGESPPDVARDLGVTDAAVRVAKSRILRQLRELLSEL